MRTARALGAVTAIALAFMPAAGGRADEKPGEHTHPPGTPAHEHPKAPVRATMEELHKHGGVPPGWRFTFPDGDPKAGRAVFVKLECFKCHEVKGEQFPSAPRTADAVGPALTGMGNQHPAEYFAESILNPNAVILTEPGFTGQDGLSVMPDYRESLTVAELIDLVAYVKSLTTEPGQVPAAAPRGGAQTPGHAHPPRPPKSQ